MIILSLIVSTHAVVITVEPSPFAMLIVKLTLALQSTCSSAVMQLTKHLQVWTTPELLQLTHQHTTTQHILAEIRLVQQSQMSEVCPMVLYDRTNRYDPLK